MINSIDSYKRAVNPGKQYVDKYIKTDVAV